MVRRHPSQLITAIVNCREFDAGPVARIAIPQRVPYGFHAVWWPGSVLERAVTALQLLLYDALGVSESCFLLAVWVQSSL